MSSSRPVLSRAEAAPVGDPAQDLAAHRLGGGDLDDAARAVDLDEHVEHGAALVFHDRVRVATQWHERNGDHGGGIRSRDGQREREVGRFVGELQQVGGLDLDQLGGLGGARGSDRELQLGRQRRGRGNERGPLQRGDAGEVVAQAFPLVDQRREAEGIGDIDRGGSAALELEDDLARAGGGIRLVFAYRLREGEPQVDRATGGDGAHPVADGLAGEPVVGEGQAGHHEVGVGVVDDPHLRSALGDIGPQLKELDLDAGRKLARLRGLRRARGEREHEGQRYATQAGSACGGRRAAGIRGVAQSRRTPSLSYAPHARLAHARTRPTAARSRARP